MLHLKMIDNKTFLYPIDLKARNIKLKVLIFVLLHKSGCFPRAEKRKPLLGIRIKRSIIYYLARQRTNTNSNDTIKAAAATYQQTDVQQQTECVSAEPIYCIIRQMSSQVSLTISKIFNWNDSAQSNRLEIGFYSTSGTYLAHKTLNAHYYQQTLLINTSFKINYLPEHQLVISRISTVQGPTQTLIGEIEIDLAKLKEKQLLFIPFRQNQNVLQVKLYTPKPSASPALQQTSNISRQQFLQERNDFIDKLTDHEADLKKRFSEKVYNLLKDIKNRGSSEGKERAKSSRGKNQIEFRSRLSPEKIKVDMNKRDGLSKAELRGPSPGKPKPQHQLLINSMENKAGTDAQDLEYQFQSQAKKQQKNNQIPQQTKYPFGGLLEQDSRR